jgi:hypothetical protein
MRQLLDKFLNSVLEKYTTWNTGEVVYSIPRFVWLRVLKPVNHDRLPKDFSAQLVKAKSVPERRVLLLHNVYVSRYGEVFRTFKLFSPSLEGVNNFNWYRTIKLFLRRILNAKIISLNGTSAVVHDRYSGVNYYHWMIEALPRLILVQKLYPNCTIILPDRPKPFITATIEAFGLKNVKALHHNEIIKTSALIFPELVYYDGVENEKEPPTDLVEKDASYADEFFKQELIVFVRKKLLDHYFTTPSKPFRKVYISRSLQNIRKLENESEVLMILQRYGFETYFFEEMSFQQQVQLMRETKFFISVHGSNLVNIIFLAEGAQVIEMMNESYVNDAYYLIASTLGLPYHSVPCRMTPDCLQKVQNDKSYFINSADLTVDIDFFEKVVQRAVGESECEGERVRG